MTNYQKKQLRMDGLVNAGKIYFLGWASYKTRGEKNCFETDDTIPLNITNEAQDAVRELFLKTKLQKGWFRIGFLIDFKKESATMIDINVGRDGAAMF